MAPQLYYTTAYKEQFASPGRTKREEPRPTSANRRNNPQPRPDFLFPHSLQPTYRSRRALSHSSPSVDSGRPLFPPVRHLSFHSPLTTCPDNHINTVEKLDRMPPVNPAAAQALPSADRLQKLQLTDPYSGFKLHSALKNPVRVDWQRNPLSAQQHRQHAGSKVRTRPQTSYPTQYRRSSSNGIQHYSGCYSCFHVVKPYQAGHYVIHPEFVSESLR